MARTEITVQEFSGKFGGDEITFDAVDQPNGNVVINDGRTVLIFHTTGAGPTTATVNSVPDQWERTGDITTDSLADDEYAVIYPWQKSIFNQRTGDDAGKATIDYSGAAMEVAAVRLT